MYDTDNLHKVTFVKNLLEYSDDFSRSVAKNSLWYLDTTDTSVVADNAGFAARKSLMTDANVIVTISSKSWRIECHPLCNSSLI